MKKLQIYGITWMTLKRIMWSLKKQISEEYLLHESTFIKFKKYKIHAQGYIHVIKVYRKVKE